MTVKAWAAPFEKAAAQIAPDAELPFALAGQTGSMTVLLYAPKGEDNQTAHSQDEIYIVQKGTAELETESGLFALGPGDTAFVPAGMDHRFKSFSADFATWAVFWGPEGGEKDQKLYRFL